MLRRALKRSKGWLHDLCRILFRSAKYGTSKGGAPERNPTESVPVINAGSHKEDILTSGETVSLAKDQDTLHVTDTVSHPDQNIASQSNESGLQLDGPKPDENLPVMDSASHEALTPQNELGDDQTTVDSIGVESSFSDVIEPAVPDTIRVDDKDPDPPPPRRISGRRKGSPQTEPTAGSGNRPSPKPQETKLRPELVCRRLPGSLHWDILVSADTDHRIAAVKQAGESMRLEYRGWPVMCFNRSLNIDFEQGRSVKISLFEKHPLVFKMKKNWKGYGRMVPRLTKGYFIVIAPAYSSRYGHKPYGQQACFDTSFMAHYFYRDGNESAEDLGGFSEHELHVNASGFKLIGKHVFDDSTDGELFVESPPQLRCVDQVVWARIGEEVVGGGWGCNFMPSERTLSEVLNGRQGRFFVRVYDGHGTMLDGDQFRYLRGLREIRINGEPYSKSTILVPSESGHSPTVVRFINGAGKSIDITEKPGSGIKHHKAGGLIAEPHPDADELVCVMDAEGDRVEVSLRLPRIWWRLERESTESLDDWYDKPLTMTRREFQEAADSKAELHLRLKERIKSILVGFDDERGLKFPRKKERDFVLPLVEFVRHDQINLHLTKDALLRIRFSQTNESQSCKQLTLIRILGDPQPSIVLFKCKPRSIVAGEKAILKWETQNAGEIQTEIYPEFGRVGPAGSLEITPAKATTFTLRLTAPGMEDIKESVTVEVECKQPLPSSEENLVALVPRVTGGWRRGRGFSRRELKAAGITTAEAARKSIRVDKRRRSVHPSNINQLNVPIND